MAIELEAIGGQRELARVEDVGAVQDVGVGLGEGDPQPRRRTTSRARLRGLEVTPRAGRHQPAAARPDEVGGVVAEDARAVRAPEVEVGGVGQVEARRVEAPQARVGGVEEARPGGGGGQPHGAPVADRTPVLLGDEPDVAQAELSEAAGGTAAVRELDAEVRQRHLVVDVERVAQVVSGPGHPGVRLPRPRGHVRPGQGHGQLGRVDDAVEPTAPQLLGGLPVGEGQRDRALVERSAESVAAQVQREPGPLAHSRGRGDVRRHGRHRHEAFGRGVDADRARSHQVDRAEPSHDLEAGEHVGHAAAPSGQGAGQGAARGAGQRAGTPRTVVPGATSCTTTEPAPTTAPSPTSIPGRTWDPLPIFAPRRSTGGPDGRDPIVRPPLTITWAPKKQIVLHHHPTRKPDVALHPDAVADHAVASDRARVPDRGVHAEP